MMDKKARGIEEIIQKAMQEGAFDNLPGKGQPLDLDDNPHLDPEWQLAYHLLKENGYAPEFIEKRQVIELELAEARAALARSWAWRAQALQDGKPSDWVEAEWTRAKAKFEEQMGKINKQIRDYNLTIPGSAFYKRPVLIEEEYSVLTK